MYHQNYYKLIGTDLSTQTNILIGTPEQINFTGKLEQDDAATVFFIAEKQQKNNFKFFFRFIVTE